MKRLRARTCEKERNHCIQSTICCMYSQMSVGGVRYCQSWISRKAYAVTAVLTRLYQAERLLDRRFDLRSSTDPEDSKYERWMTVEVGACYLLMSENRRRLVELMIS